MAALHVHIYTQMYLRVSRGSGSGCSSHFHLSFTRVCVCIHVSPCVYMRACVCIYIPRKAAIKCGGADTNHDFREGLARQGGKGKGLQDTIHTYTYIDPTHTHVYMFLASPYLPMHIAANTSRMQKSRSGAGA